MKAIAILLLMLASQAPVDQMWLEVFKGDSISVDVERVLYEPQDNSGFLMHFRVANRTPKNIGVDLSQRYRVFYINQWVQSDLEYRQVIDELFTPPVPLIDRLRKEVQDSYTAGKLTQVPAGGTADYFVDFSAPRGGPEIDKGQHPFVIFSIKGQLLSTDGTQVWSAVADKEFNIRRPGRPAIWRKLPEGANVVRAW